MINCGSTMKGTVSLAVYDREGNLKETRTVSNKIVYNGTKVIASLLSGTPLPLPSHMACGTGSLDPILNDDKLEAEVALVPLDGPGTHNENSTTFVATFGPNVPNIADKPITQVTEVGIWCINPEDENDKYLLNRATFAVVNKTRDDTIIVNWVVTVLSDDTVIE